MAKLRMLQLAKWDIVRAKEKEGLAHLNQLKKKQRNGIKCITHSTLFQIMTHIATQMNLLKLKKERIKRRLMGSLILTAQLKQWLKRKGPTLRQRLQNKARNVLTFMNYQITDNIQEKAKEGFLWFMRESASMNQKKFCFTSTVKYVIKLQRVYRNVKLRRVVHRTLMDKVWD